jgi:hypothetical protein
MTIPRPQQWTEAEVHRLRMLVKRKVSADSIAKSLGRYVGSVKTKAREFASNPLQEAQGEEMTEQEELIQDIRERLGEMPKRALPFDLLAFATTIGERYSMTQNEIIRLVMQEAEALGVNYRIGSAGR